MGLFNRNVRYQRLILKSMLTFQNKRLTPISLTRSTCNASMHLADEALLRVMAYSNQFSCLRFVMSHTPTTVVTLEMVPSNGERVNSNLSLSLSLKKSSQERIS